MKVAIIGSRGFPKRADRVRNIVRGFHPYEDAIVTGTWPAFDRQTVDWGVDEWAVIHAFSHGLFLRVFPPKPKPGVSFGQACARRNREIAATAEHCIALWDGASRGTAMTIGFFKDLGKTVEIVEP